MKIGWLSDIHLNFLDDDAVTTFIGELATTGVDAWVISGDIGEAHSVLDYLDRLASGLDRPVCFVLGNHDYYRGSIAGVSREVAAAARADSLVWLTSSGPIEMDEDLCIVGDDGWGDARFGDPIGSRVELNDFHLIEELEGLGRSELIAKANALGDESADRLAPKLDQAALHNAKVCIVTHVPPFEGAAWYDGRQSGPEWLPWFSCAATGRVILDCAERNPDVDFLVLCGHTHGHGCFQASRNVAVHTAGAKYGSPCLQGIVIAEGARLRVHPV
ncbi:MAG: phosphoesterase [Candidatus Eisenbacteria bacterium]|nr:phosphoesterase [Candidatus Latescibacterota bacterium]MBD3302016.1 phosphoesterase [Candidatus Eisenbacteria bacterium]